MKALRALQWLAVAFAAAALLGPLAHVLEFPNKMRLEGPLWLEIQQRLYNGWGPLLGGPSEIGGLVVCLVLVGLGLGEPRWRRRYGLAALAYLAMLACFFLLNAPVNRAVSGWTAQTLPADWPRYRLRWETGHALACVFALVAAVACVTGLGVRPPQAARGRHHRRAAAQAALRRRR